MFIGTTALLIGGAVAAAAGGVGQAIAGGQAASAAQSIAEAQAKAAKDVAAQQAADRQTALGLAAPTASETAAIARQYQLSEDSLTAQLKAIDQDRELLNSVEPALKEAGVQAYQLLQGKQAAALGPIQDQRNQQRAMLESNLRDSLGSGFATSSAGTLALAQFDAQTAGVMQQAQQQTLGAFLGTAAAVRPNIAGETGQAYSLSSQLGATALAGQQNLQARQVAAFNGSPVNYAPLISTAGASNVGALGNAQAMGNLFGNIGGLGGSVLGAGIQQNSLENLLKRSDVSGNVSIGASVPGMGSGGYGYGSGSSVPQQYNSPYFGPIR